MTHQQRHQSLGIHGLHEHEGAHRIRRVAMLNISRRMSMRAVGALVGGLLLVLVVRHFQGRALHEATEQSAKTHVSYVSPKKGAAQYEVELPATFQGFEETAVFARSAGYVTKWYKDIGDQVKAGDLLATLAAPEVEREWAQAQSNLELARISDERWRAMRERDAVSQQEFDERHAAYLSALATAQRLEKLVSYAKIVAPFDGVVTKRNIDVGSLVDVGNGGAAKMLFAVSHAHILRLYVAVPQLYSQGVKVGAPAQVRVSEFPGKLFSAKVVRASGGIDPVTRTLQVEVDLPNDDGLLLPGAYATVTLSLKSPASQMLTVPNNALLFRPEGVFVVVVEQDQAHLKPVRLGKDLGTLIQIEDGLSEQDHIVINPPDGILDQQALVATAWQDPNALASSAAAASSAASAASTTPASGARP